MRAPSTNNLLASLPEPLLRQSRERIGTMALLLAGVMVVAEVLIWVWVYVLGSDTAHLYAVHNDVLSLVIAVLLFAATRTRRLSNLGVLRLSRVMVVLLALSLSTLTHINFYASYGQPPMLTWVALLAALFPLLIPASPRVTALHAAIIAATAPVGMWLARLLDGGAIELADTLAVSIHPIFSVGMAVVGSTVIYRRLTLEDVVEEREHMLDLVLENADLAVVMATDEGQIVFANQPAHELLGPELDGSSLDATLRQFSEGLATAVAAEGRDLVTMERDGKRDVLHVVSGTLPVEFVPHRLVLIRRMTAELNRAEIAAYKRLIRIIGHELNNTLGPISSMLRSATTIADRPQHRHRLVEVLERIGGHTERLSSFLGRYIEYVKLPPPRLELVSWGELLERLRILYPVTIVGELPSAPLRADPEQLLQVLINLVKNAHEAGSPVDEVTVAVGSSEDGVAVEVSDRGAGMSTETIARAQLPFFTTKAGGSGLGLALCAEIIEAHHGELDIEQREGGGTTIRCWLPRSDAPQGR